MEGRNVEERNVECENVLHYDDLVVQGGVNFCDKENMQDCNVVEGQNANKDNVQGEHGGEGQNVTKSHGEGVRLTSKNVERPKVVYVEPEDVANYNGDENDNMINANTANVKDSEEENDDPPYVVDDNTSESDSDNETKDVEHDEGDVTGIRFNDAEEDTNDYGEFDGLVTNTTQSGIGTTEADTGSIKRKRVTDNRKYVDTAPWVNWHSKGYIYAMAGDLKAKDFKVGCYVKLVAPTSWWALDTDKFSYTEMHRALFYGFEISWMDFACHENHCGNSAQCYFDSSSQKLRCCPRFLTVLSIPCGKGSKNY
ncbi:Receptor protein kinase isoform X1 [Spatholobus suberectus]|nr:Receptor protein kinase isoform X1 [Spatholobus suberectus]